MLEDLRRERIRKLGEYRKYTEPYPATTDRNSTVQEFLAAFDENKKSGSEFTVAVRLFALRDQGKILFADARDASGTFQLIFDGDNTKNLSLLKETLDIGDFVEARGYALLTKRGEQSMQVVEARLLAKAIRPIPATWYGLEDIETKLRKRYLDLLLHPEVRELFNKKQRFWASVRKFLTEASFLEVETPVLEASPGGADAEPFITHHNALDRDFYLRISLELALKRLLVGGFEKIFEIGRVFRNEGIDREHLQDYTEMECYAAYWDHRAMMRFVKRLFQYVVKESFGSLTIQSGDTKINWGNEWEELDYSTLFQKTFGVNLINATRDQLFDLATTRGLKPEKSFGFGKIVDLLYKKEIRPTIIKPSFLTGHPLSISPLAKVDPKHPTCALRFQVLALGSELGNGWAELNDPLEQRARFEEQMKLREAGDSEAQRLDEDFLESLEYGMPPAAGFGMSERFFAVLTGKPARETTLFPLMKEE